MSDLLIKQIDPELEHALEESARAHGRSVSDEAKSVLGKSMLGDAVQGTNKAVAPAPAGPETMGMGTWLASLVAPEDRGDDLDFEYHGDFPKPPNFD